MRKYKLIVFSGMDSSGKSTQVFSCIDYFHDLKERVAMIWGRPYGTPFFRLLSKIKQLPNKLKHHNISQKNNTAHDKELYKSLPADSEVSIAVNSNIPDKVPENNLSFHTKVKITFVVLDFILTLVFKISKEGKKNRIIICDRYICDAFVDLQCQYNFFGIEKWSIIKLLMKIVPKPDLSIVFTIDEVTQRSRLLLKNENPVSSSKYKLIRNSYDYFINKGFYDVAIDGNRSIDDIRHQIVANIERTIIADNNTH